METKKGVLLKYRQKAAILAALNIFLILIFILSFVFDPEKRGSASFAWLSPSMLDLVDRVEISGSGSFSAAAMVLSRRNNRWVFDTGTDEYPVKQYRVEELLAVLSAKRAYTIKAVSEEGRERLGFSSGSNGDINGIASRILVRGGSGMPLLDLLVGSADALGREVYLKRADKSEIYSGEDLFTEFTESRPNFWLDLRLFPPDAAVSSVQEAEIMLPAIDAISPPYSYSLRRKGGGWIMPGEANAELDTAKVDSWLRSVLEAEAGDIGGMMSGTIDGRITLYLGDGSNVEISISPPLEEMRRSALVSDSRFVFILPQWTVNRLWRESEYFLEANR